MLIEDFFRLKLNEQDSLRIEIDSLSQQLVDLENERYDLLKADYELVLNYLQSNTVVFSDHNDIVYRYHRIPMNHLSTKYNIVESWDEYYAILLDDSHLVRVDPWKYNSDEIVTSYNYEIVNTNIIRFTFTFKINPVFHINFPVIPRHFSRTIELPIEHFTNYLRNGHYL